MDMLVFTLCCCACVCGCVFCLSHKVALLNAHGCEYVNKARSNFPSFFPKVLTELKPSQLYGTTLIFFSLDWSTNGFNNLRPNSFTNQETPEPDIFVVVPHTPADSPVRWKCLLSVSHSFCPAFQVNGCI